MPNWCANKVTFKHALPKELHKIARAWNNGKLISTFLPCPHELKETVSGCAGPKGSPAQVELELKEQRNLETYGAKNWYDWQVAHWGTKWDVGREREQDRINLPAEPKQLTLRFDSAWSPPIEFYDHLRFKCGFLVEAMFYEPGVGFWGIYDNGVQITKHLPTTQAELDEIPKELVEEFGLADCLRNNDMDDDDDEQEED